MKFYLGGGSELVNMPRKFKFVADLTKLIGTLKSYVRIFMVSVVARVKCLPWILIGANLPDFFMRFA